MLSTESGSADMEPSLSEKISFPNLSRFEKNCQISNKTSPEIREGRRSTHRQIEEKP